MANDYATVEDVYNIVDLDPEKYSTIMQFMLDSAAQHIDNLTHHDSGFKGDSTATTRLFAGNDKSVIDIDEATQITLVETKTNFDDSFVSWTSNDWIAFSGSVKQPNFNKLPYTKIMINPNGDYSYFPHISVFGHSWGLHNNDTHFESVVASYPNIRVTAKWGYAIATPDVIKNCTILQATRWIKRAQAAYGDSLVNTDLGQIMFVRKFDNDLAAMLFQGNYMRVQI